MKTKSSLYFAIFLLFMLGFLSYIVSVIPANDKLLVLIASYSLIIGGALFIGLDKKSIGLSKLYIKNGVALALPFMVIIMCGAIAIFIAYPEIFKDSRYQQSLQSLLYSIFIVLPIYTVLVEELAFRGVLLASLLRTTTEKTAIIISSLAFGLWHFFTASALTNSPISENFFSSEIIIVSIVILATSIAGWLFTWLRMKSGSLFAPILVHWTINATGLVLAYLAWVY